MKIKNIASICKKSKNITIFERHDRPEIMQYIGDGYAAYPAAGLPELDEETLLTIFDVPEKDRDKYHVHTSPIPDGVDFADVHNGERMIEQENVSINYGGRVLLPLRTGGGLVFIDSCYLKPVSDVLDVLELYERRTAAGMTYIVAKAGFLLQAVIMPYDVIDEKFVEMLHALASDCGLTLDAKKHAARLEHADDPEQFTLPVDPDTGELLEDGNEVAEE